MIKAAVQAEVTTECNDMFINYWITDCTDKIDPTQIIADCIVDYCMDNTMETKRDIMDKFIKDCASQVPEGTTAVCDWPVLAGFDTPECGEFQVNSIPKE